MMYYGGYGFEHMAGWGLFGLVVNLLIWILILVIIVAVIRRLVWGPRWMRHRRMGGMMMGDSAMDILRERYAKGEINKEEFEERKKNLEM